MTSKSAFDRQYLLRAGVGFHGHLGPYLAVGLRMGMTAVQMLKPKGLHELSATVWTRTSPPQSCILDGIQVSSGCTLGKGNIRVRESRRTKARFQKGNRTVLIGLTERVIALLSELSEQTPQHELQEIAISLYRMPDRELLVSI